MLQPGDKAPDFSGKDQNGNLIKLSDFSGKKIALYFYPKDDTPGCTTQACNLRDNYSILLDNGIQVIGVSVDSERSHQKFIAKFDLPFPLIADTDKSIVESFGVWVEKSMYGKKYMGTSRTTFLISENGTIEKVVDKVKTDNHADQLLQP